MGEGSSGTWLRHSARASIGERVRRVVAGSESGALPLRLWATRFQARERDGERWRGFEFQELLQLFLDQVPDFSKIQLKSIEIEYLGAP